ncbi:MAG: RNA-directed DNA polymerase [Nitrososphaerales archaeon]
MNDLVAAFEYENLRRAWRWIKTDSNALYKSYCRHIYKAYALSEEDNLHDLAQRLAKGTFRPSYAIKFYIPKKSGIQRVHTILSIEDHIVYQSLVNVVAERLADQIRGRYGRKVFGNLYTSARSKFFYRSWQKSYSSFSRALQKAYDEGYVYTASFDLVACYDSIDHAVLEHFLNRLNLSKEFIQYLRKLLANWTAASSEKPIYHNHGIPVGPLASGLLAEVVLRHFDENDQKARSVRYFRYVDDIRLFARTEKALRQRLIALDLRSKEIGLFPQSSKIDIHRVVDIQQEIKSISNPPEEVTTNEPSTDQTRIRRRLSELSPRLVVINETRFKYVLGLAKPNAELSNRLLRIAQRYPHLHHAIFSYLRKGSMPRSISSRCLDILKQNDLYSSFTADLIRTLSDLVHKLDLDSFLRYCRGQIFGASRSRNTEVRAAAASALLKANRLTWGELKNLLFVESEPWWFRSELIRHIKSDHIGSPSLESILNDLMRDKSPDVALVASEALIRTSLVVQKPVRNIQKLAQYSLRKAGLIGRVVSATCPISEAMKEVLGPRVSPIEWHKIFSPKRVYERVVRHVSSWQAYSTTDSTAWVNLTDVINDAILEALFAHDANIGAYQLGNIGGVLNPWSRFAKAYPKLYIAVASAHRLRSESQLTHPVNRKTQKVTRPIQFKETEKLKHGFNADFWVLP